MRSLAALPPLLATAIHREPVVSASSWFAERAGTAVAGAALLAVIALFWYAAFQAVRRYLERGHGEPTRGDEAMDKDPQEGAVAAWLLGACFVASSLLCALMLASWRG